MWSTPAIKKIQRKYSNNEIVCLRAQIQTNHFQCACIYNNIFFVSNRFFLFFLSRLCLDLLSFLFSSSFMCVWWCWKVTWIIESRTIYQQLFPLLVDCFVVIQQPLSLKYISICAIMRWTAKLIDSLEMKMATTRTIYIYLFIFRHLVHMKGNHLRFDYECHTIWMIIIIIFTPQMSNIQYSVFLDSNTMNRRRKKLHVISSHSFSQSRMVFLEANIKYQIKQKFVFAWCIAADIFNISIMYLIIRQTKSRKLLFFLRVSIKNVFHWIPCC